MFFLKKIKGMLNIDHDAINFSVAGFPRSANTFLAIFLHRRKLLSGGRLKIHSHDHSVEYLQKISTEKAYCLVPIRNPIDAITSTYIFFDSKKTIDELSFWYFEYYSYVFSHIDNFLVVNFDDVIKDPNCIIGMIGRKYSFLLKEVENIEKEKGAIFKWMGRQSKRKFRRGEERHMREVGFPQEKRAVLKITIQKEVELFFESNKEPLRIYEEVIKQICGHY